MPTIPSIRTSVENQKSLILDEHAKNGVFKRDKRGRLVAYTGGFSVVFPYSVGTECWAFRCWHAELGNVRRRFEIISEAIQRSRLPYLCEFSYTDEGILVDGKIYPTTRMKWVDGVTLKDYICDHAKEKKLMLKLADNFLSMIKDLHREKIAHGDLQHGNIMVGNDGKLYLVDYDSLYCPELKGEADIISGLADYQHPARRLNHVTSEKIDYFSELIIYLSILGIAEKPELAESYHIRDCDRLLFEANDYNNIKVSKIFSELSGLGGDIPLLLDILNDYLKAESIQDLEPFDNVLERLTKAPEIIFFKPSSNSIYNGEQVTLEWKVDNVSALYVNDIEVTGKASYSLTPKNGDNKIILKAINRDKSTSASCQITSFPLPQISFKSSVKKLKKGKQDDVELTWHVQNHESVTLNFNGKSENVKSDGKKTIKVKESTTFTLRVIGKDKKRSFEKSIQVGVFNEAMVSFTSDKAYTLPGVPIVLSWNVQNAKKIELDGFGEVSATGNKTIEIEQEKTFSLIVSDAFDKTKHSLTIRMLPLPHIQTLMVPAPQIEKTINISVNTPSLNIQHNIPTVDITGVDLKVHQVPSLSELGLDVKIPSTKYSAFSLWKEMKSLFRHYRNKTRE